MGGRSWQVALFGGKVIWTKITQDCGLQNVPPYTSSLYGVRPQIKILIRKREKNKKIKTKRGLGDRAWPSIFIAKCILIQDPRDFHPMLNMYVVLTTSSPQLFKA